MSDKYDFTELNNFLKESIEKMQSMQKKFENIPDEQEDEFPKFGVKYWTPDCNKIDEYVFMDLAFDRSIRSLGLMFRTKEECEKAMQHMTDTEILKEDAKGYKPVWDGSHNYGVYIDHEENSLDYVATNCIDRGEQIWFASKDDVCASIEKHRDIWLRYFGVEGDNTINEMGEYGSNFIPNSCKKVEKES